jgi:hypothetical protein
MAAMMKYDKKGKRREERLKQAQLPAAERLMKEVGLLLRFGQNRPRVFTSGA